MWKESTANSPLYSGHTYILQWPTKKKHYFKKEFELLTYSETKMCHEHDFDFIFPIDYTVLPWIYAEIMKIASFRYILLLLVFG